jgi:hypothetical protein
MYDPETGRVRPDPLVTDFLAIDPVINHDACRRALGDMPRSTWHQLVRAERLPVVDLGKRKGVRRSTLLALIARRTIQLSGEAE